MRKISQREAQQALKDRTRLENQIDTQRNAYAQAWAGGTHIGTIELDLAMYATVKTARRLGHAVVAISPNTGRIDLYALPLPSEPK